MKPPLIVRPLCLYALKDRDREKHFKLTSFRPVTFGSLLVCGFSLLILNCGLDVEDPIPPSPPVWVEKSFPEEWPESGIDAHESGGIYLEWEPNPEGDIVAYKIYRSVFDEIEGVQGEYGILARLDL